MQNSQQNSPFSGSLFAPPAFHSPSSGLANDLQLRCPCSPLPGSQALMLPPGSFWVSAKWNKRPWPLRGPPAADSLWYTSPQAQEVAGKRGTSRVLPALGHAVCGDRTWRPPGGLSCSVSIVAAPLTWTHTKVVEMSGESIKATSSLKVTKRIRLGRRMCIRRHLRIAKCASVVTCAGCFFIPMRMQNGSAVQGQEDQHRCAGHLPVERTSEKGSSSFKDFEGQGTKKSLRYFAMAAGTKTEIGTKEWSVEAALELDRESPGREATRVTSVTLLAGVALLPAPGAALPSAEYTGRTGSASPIPTRKTATGSAED
ncbi:Homeobox protein VENTX [Plecturocebus cupreus]